VQPEQAEILSKYIYELMIEKGLTRPEGHLVQDVYFEVSQHLVGPQMSSGRGAWQRVAEFLQSSPKYFTLTAAKVNPDAKPSGENEMVVRLNRLPGYDW
jgi:hypothetical protein